jgi:hypothetical protein
MLITNVKIIFSFEEEWCTLNKEKIHLKKNVHSKNLSALNMQKEF